jgi:hypothetical protein
VLHPASRDTATSFAASGLPHPKAEAVTFTLDDFTEGGRAKLLKLNPKIDGVTFTLKP